MFESIPEQTQAHRDALELLDYLHEICRASDIAYSLIGNALICHCTGTPFAFAAPDITVAVAYPAYARLIEIFSGGGPGSEKYGVAHYKNTEQFNSAGAWIYKRNRVVLPESRKADEMYYCTRISIVPIFYAGDTVRKLRNMQKAWRRSFDVVNAREPLPKQSLWFRLVNWRRKFRIRRFLRQRGSIGMDDILQNASAMQSPTKFAYCPSIKSNAIALTDVELIHWEGGGRYVPRNARGFVLENYHPRTIERISREPKSYLTLCGGETLRRIQLVQTEMLVEFDRICRKHGLKYCLSFGTLLGAVRHGGFVPWDDDADIFMPYDDYAKLEASMDQDLDSEKYYLRTPWKEKDCNITYMHLKRNHTRYCKPGRERFKFHPGIFVDIVPLFNGADTRLGHWLHTRLCWFFRTATWAHMGAGGEKKLLKRLYYTQLARIGNKRSYALFMRFATMFKRKSDKMAFFNGSVRSPYDEEVVRRSCFDDVVELEFEGHKFLAPRKYKEVLEYCYGKDYLLFPALGRRKPSHNAEIDLGGLYSFDAGTGTASRSD